MADYTSKYTGTQIDTAIGIAIALKDLRGIIKITADGPVAAVAGVDYPESSGSTVSVTGVLKGVADAETGEITIQQAGAGVDYQTPLKAGVDYAIPSAVANKQNKINTTGLLKGTGEGIVTAAQAGIDYAIPAQAKVVSLSVTNWTGESAPFAQTITVEGMTAEAKIIVSPAPASLDAYGAVGVRCTEQGANSLTFSCDSAPESDLTVNILIVG